MNFVILLAALASNAPSSPETCQKLSADFVENEQRYAFWYDINSKILNIAVESRRAMARSRREVAIGEATLGIISRPNTGTDDVSKALAELDKTDAKYKAEGDRITTLLIANRCTPPDHVTSWTTYTKKDTNSGR